jgi:predicted DNA binding protein
MRAYNGVVKDKKVYFEGDAGIKDGTEVLILLKSPLEDDEAITERQLRILDKGYNMGKIIYSSREELHER